MAPGPSALLVAVNLVVAASGFVRARHNEYQVRVIAAAALYVLRAIDVKVVFPAAGTIAA